MRKRIILLVLLGLALGAAIVHSGCFTPEVYDTPAELSAVDTSSISTGYTAIVRYQGAWSYAPDSTATPDGETVVAAQGGGAWVRLLAVGYPGALDVPEWFVDSRNGDDANNCVVAGAATAPGGEGACADLAEIFRRFAGQQPGAPTSPVIHVRGDFSQKTYVFDQAAGLLPVVIGERLYGAPDGGAYPTGVVTAYQAWNGNAHQEGVATVTAGEAPLDVATYTTALGYWLEVQGGPRDGLGVPIGEARGAGMFATSGGSLLGSYGTAEPAVGDAVRVYRLTPLSTATGTSMTWAGGGMILQNLEMGNAQHSVAMGTLTGPGNGVELDACLGHGFDVFGGSWLFEYGTVHTAGLRVYGRLVTAASTYDGLQARDDGDLELTDHTLVTYAGIRVGGRDGPGYAQIDGATCVTSYITPALQVADGQVVYLSAPWWARNAVGGVAAVQVERASAVLYDDGMAPSCVGTCAAAPWDVGGTGYSTLPALNDGAAIAENE